MNDADHLWGIFYCYFKFWNASNFRYTSDILRTFIYNCAAYTPNFIKARGHKVEDGVCVGLT